MNSLINNYHHSLSLSDCHIRRLEHSFDEFEFGSYPTSTSSSLQSSSLDFSSTSVSPSPSVKELFPSIELISDASLNSLPYEILAHLFSYFSRFELHHTLRRVCFKFNNVIKTFFKHINSKPRFSLVVSGTGHTLLCAVGVSGQLHYFPIDGQEKENSILTPNKDSATPTNEQGLGCIKRVYSGPNFLLAMSHYGEVNVWTTKKTMATRHPMLKQSFVKACGGSNTFSLLSDDGKLYHVSINSQNKLDITENFSGRENMKGISSMLSYRGDTLVLTQQQELAQCGKSMSLIPCNTLQRKVNRICGGKSCVFARLDDKSWMCWGENAYGQLGIGKESLFETKPQDFVCNTKMEWIETGYSHSLGLSEKGRVYSWGSNVRHQLGNASKCIQSIPEEVELPNGKVSWICALQFLSFAASYSEKEGAARLFVWGTTSKQVEYETPTNIENNAAFLWDGSRKEVNGFDVAKYGLSPLFTTSPLGKRGQLKDKMSFGGSEVFEFDEASAEMEYFKRIIMTSKVELREERM